MNRRGFLASAAALWAVTKLRPRICSRTTPAPVLAPVLWGDGKHDDTAALNAWGAGKPVVRPDGRPVGPRLEGMSFLMSGTMVISRQDPIGIFHNRFKYVGPYPVPPTLYFLPGRYQVG